MLGMYKRVWLKQQSKDDEHPDERETWGWEGSKTENSRKRVNKKSMGARDSYRRSGKARLAPTADTSTRAIAASAEPQAE